MTKKNLKVRKIVFGIRFKFSIIIILAVAFAAVLIGFALINQHEEKTRDALQRQGATILHGIADQGQIFLNNKHLLTSQHQTPISPLLAKKLREDQADALKNIGKYFSSVIGKELNKIKKEDRVLDIAFIIDITWNDLAVDWKRSDQSKYFYFNRITGAPFVQKGGMNDPLLEPTIFKHYMTTVDTKTFIGFADISDVQDQYKYLFKDMPDYIIVGIPILNEQTDIYNRYLQFKQGSISKISYNKYKSRKNNSQENISYRLAITKESLRNYLTSKNSLPGEFIDRIIKNGLNLDYIIELKNKKQIEIMLNFLSNRSAVYRMKPEDQKKYTLSLKSSIQEKIINNKISISTIYYAWSALNKRSRLLELSNSTRTHFNQDLYFYLLRNIYTNQLNKNPG